MKIMIIGAGFTGTQLAKRLINEKNDVILIDSNPDVAHHTEGILDCTVQVVEGNNLQNLEDCGIAKMDALVVLTENDEINIVTCSLVDAVYPNLLKIARVRNYAYYVNSREVSKFKSKKENSFAQNSRPLYGIDYMVHPDVEAAQAIVKAVEHGAISDVLTFGEDDFELTALEIQKDSKMDGIALKNIRHLCDHKFIVVYLETEEGACIPSGETILKAGNRIGILAEKENIQQILLLCGTKLDSLRKIALVGAGKIGTLVADYIMKTRQSSFFTRIFGGQKKLSHDFVIIDSNKELCKQIAAKYPSAEVFCGDATDENFILEEGIQNFDLVICATHNHEMNMVVSAYLESLGVGKTISLVAHSDLADISRKLGIDVPIPLRDTLVDSIMSHLHGKSVTGIHTLENGEFEIIECDLSENSKLKGCLLKDISSPGDFLLLLIKKPGSKKYELPAGNTVLSAGDHLVLIERAGNKKILEKMSGIK